MKTKLFVLALVACVCAALHAAVFAAPAPPDQTIRLMRHPDINQGRIVFSYQNDLWLVPEEGGAARRITTHIGVEDYPEVLPRRQVDRLLGRLQRDRRGRLRDARGGRGAGPAHVRARRGGPRRVDARRKGRRLLLEARVLLPLFLQTLPRSDERRASRRDRHGNGELRLVLAGRRRRSRTTGILRCSGGGSGTRGA